MNTTESALPNAAKFMREVLRGSTYTFASALADLVDNCIESGATRVDIWVDYANFEVMVMDNGSGMSDSVHRESMKIASETRDYSGEDLGKYGTGMKAASLSQARRLIVATRPRDESAAFVRCLDMDHINATNDWGQLTLVMSEVNLPDRALRHLKGTPGTVVIWQQMDRVFADGSLFGSAAEAELKSQTSLAETHLAMVFHRFILGTTKNREPLGLFINGNAIEAWDPFARDERTIKVAETQVQVNGSIVSLTGYVLPSEKEFSSRSAFVAAAGPKKWNDSQGFYVFRNDRLIKWGGWLRIRATDEHTKLARVALDFSSDLDSIFQVNVAKSTLVLPVAIREKFSGAIKEVTAAALKRYRAKIIPAGTSALPMRGPTPTATVERKIAASTFVEILGALAKANGLDGQLADLKSALKRENPKLAQEVGWL